MSRFPTTHWSVVLTAAAENEAESPWEGYARSRGVDAKSALTIHCGENACNIQVSAHVELGREAELEIPDSLRETVLADLVCDALECFGIVEHGTRVREPVQ